MINWHNLPASSTNPCWYGVPATLYCPICDRPLIELPELAYSFCPVHRYRLTDEQRYAHAFAYVEAINRINTLSTTYSLPFDLNQEAAEIDATRGAA